MGPDLNALLLRHPNFQPSKASEEQRFPKQLAKRMLRDVLLGLCFLHSRGIVHADLHPGNVLATICHFEVNTGSIQKLQQLASQGEPLERIDGKPDPWAPSYLLEPAPLFDSVSFELSPVVKIIDLGAGKPNPNCLYYNMLIRLAFFEGHPAPKTVVPVALRAPEIIFNLPLGKEMDIWCFGCLVFELLTGRALFLWLDSLSGGASDEVTNDEHLIQLSEILGPLPGDMLSKWRRRDQYYGPDGKRLVDPTDADESDCEDDGESADNSSIASGISWSTGSLMLAPSTHFAPLAQRLRDEKLDDLGEDEEREVVQLLQWILQYDASKRPSTQTILEHPWFSSI